MGNVTIEKREDVIWGLSVLTFGGGDQNAKAQHSALHALPQP